MGSVGTLGWFGQHANGGLNQTGKLTWAHVEGAATAKVVGDILLRSKAKISKLDGLASVRNEHVLRFQVPVIYSYRMTMNHGIQDLQESLLGQRVVSWEQTSFGDGGEQITLPAVFEHDESAILGFHDLDKGNHVWMVACFMVEQNLPLLESS